MHTHRYKLRQTHTNIYNHKLTQTLKQQHIHTYLKTILLSFTKYTTLTAGTCEHLCCRQERMKSVFEVNQRMCYGWIKCFTNLTIPIPIIVIIKLKFGQDFKVNFRSKHWGWDLVKVLKLKLGQDFEAEFCSRLWGKFLVEFFLR